MRDTHASLAGGGRRGGAGASVREGEEAANRALGQAGSVAGGLRLGAAGLAGSGVGWAGWPGSRLGLSLLLNRQREETKLRENYTIFI